MFDWFWEFLYTLMMSLMSIVDFMLDAFRVLCGVEPINVDGESTTLLDRMLSDKTISQAASYIIYIAAGLLFVITIIAIVRMIALGDKTNETPGAIIVKAFKSLILFFLVPALMIVGVTCVNTIVGQVDKVTQSNYTETAGSGTASDTCIGGQLLVTIGENAWTQKGSVLNKENRTEAEKSEIRRKFIARESGYDYCSLSDVQKYYNLDNLDYGIGFIVAIVFLIVLAMCSIQFVTRLFDIILLYLIAPFPISVSVLDDGHRFKMWRDQVIVKFLSAYSIIIALNIYMLLIPIVRTVDFGISMHMIGVGVVSTSVTNLLIQLFIMIGGAFAIQKSTVLFGNLISQGAGSQEAADASHAFGGAKMLMGMTAGRALTALQGGARNVGSSISKGINSATGRTDKKEQQREARSIYNHSKAQDIADKRLAKENGGGKASSSLRTPSARTAVADALRPQADKGGSQSSPQDGGSGGTASRSMRSPAGDSMRNRVSDTVSKSKGGEKK